MKHTASSAGVGTWRRTSVVHGRSPTGRQRGDRDVEAVLAGDVLEGGPHRLEPVDRQRPWAAATLCEPAFHTSLSLSAGHNSQAARTGEAGVSIEQQGRNADEFVLHKRSLREHPAVSTRRSAPAGKTAVRVCVRVRSEGWRRGLSDQLLARHSCVEAVEHRPRALPQLR